MKTFSKQCGQNTTKLRQRTPDTRHAYNRQWRVPRRTSKTRNKQKINSPAPSTCIALLMRLRQRDAADANIFFKARHNEHQASDPPPPAPDPSSLAPPPNLLAVDRSAVGIPPGNLRNVGRLRNPSARRLLSKTTQKGTTRKGTHGLL